MIFENSQIPVSELPKVEDVEYQQLAPAYRTVELVATSLLFGFFLLGWLVFFFVNPFRMPWLNWGLLAVWGLLFAFGLRNANRRFRMEGYALREHDILHKHGVWWRTVTAIPFNRMQHCEISRGPVENAFGLATLRVYTAGGSSSDLSIEGLLFEEAQRIKEFITQKIGGAGNGL
ncbi:MAG: PH domain-containing protein [Bacteroidetes bacterium]|nr:PH domain-containing protein [Bacteroidota bacterium]